MPICTNIHQLYSNLCTQWEVVRATGTAGLWFSYRQSKQITENDEESGAQQRKAMKAKQQAKCTAKAKLMGSEALGVELRPVPVARAGEPRVRIVEVVVILVEAAASEGAPKARARAIAVLFRHGAADVGANGIWFQLQTKVIRSQSLNVINTHKVKQTSGNP